MVRGVRALLGLYPRNTSRVPHISDFLSSFVGSLNFMRLSLMKGAHAILSRAAYRKFGASRSFFARCGIPQVLPSSLLRSPQLRTGALRSHQRTWAENDGRSPPQLFVPDTTFVICGIRSRFQGRPVVSHISRKTSEMWGTRLWWRGWSRKASGWPRS